MHHVGPPHQGSGFDINSFSPSLFLAEPGTMNMQRVEPLHPAEFEGSQKMVGEIGPAHPARNNKAALYKTELCRKYSQTGYCRYGAKCQFAHGIQELRTVVRHPLYKTSKCKTFQQNGSCPYGSRCRFIHDDADHKLAELARGLATMSTTGAEQPVMVSPGMGPAAISQLAQMSAMGQITQMQQQQQQQQQQQHQQQMAAYAGVAGTTPASVLDFMMLAKGNPNGADALTQNVALQLQLSQAQLLVQAQAQINAQLNQLKAQMPELDTTSLQAGQASQQIAHQQALAQQALMTPQDLMKSNISPDDSEAVVSTTPRSTSPTASPPEVLDLPVTYAEAPPAPE